MLNALIVEPLGVSGPGTLDAQVAYILVGPLIVWFEVVDVVVDVVVVAREVLVVFVLTVVVSAKNVVVEMSCW